MRDDLIVISVTDNFVYQLPISVDDAHAILSMPSAGAVRVTLPSLGGYAALDEDENLLEIRFDNGESGPNPNRYVVVDYDDVCAEIRRHLEERDEYN